MIKYIGMKMLFPILKSGSKGGIYGLLNLNPHIVTYHKKVLFTKKNYKLSLIKMYVSQSLHNMHDFRIKP